MMNMDEAGLAAFGRFTGQTAADAIFERAFALCYAMAGAPGKPLLQANEATFRDKFDELMESVVIGLINDLPKGTEAERKLFLENVRAAAVERFTARLKAKWASLVTQ